MLDRVIDVNRQNTIGNVFLIDAHITVAGNVVFEGFAHNFFLGS